MKILVVDDSKAMRKIVIRTLRQAGFGDHDCIEAENGAVALDLIGKENPQLVLCDWNMPEMNGEDCCKQARSAGFTGVFGFITTEGTPAMRQRANEAGANFLLAKPFTAEELERVLNVHVG